MQLEELNTAWQQMKLAHHLMAPDTRVVLQSTPEGPETMRVKLTRVALSFVVFVVLVITCQGG